MASLQDSLDALGGSIAELAKVVNKGTDRSQVGAKRGAGGNPLGFLTSAFDKLIGGAMATFGASLTALGGDFTSLVNQSRVFAAALNPAALFGFDQVVRNLMATIGGAVVPIFQVLGGVLNEVAGIILPLAEQLAPIFQKIAEAGGSVLVGAVELLTSWFEALAPVIEFLVDIFKQIGDGLKVFGIIMGQFVKVVVGDLVGGLQSGFKGFLDAIKEAVKWLVVLAAKIAVIFAGMSVLDGVLTRLAHPPSGGALSAPTDAAVSGIQQIASQIATGAFTASGGGPQQQTNDFLRDIQASLEGIRNDNTVAEWRKAVLDCRDFLRTIAGGIGAARDFAVDATTGIVNDSTINSNARLAGFALGGRGGAWLAAQIEGLW